VLAEAIELRERLVEADRRGEVGRIVGGGRVLVPAGDLLLDARDPRLLIEDRGDALLGQRRGTDAHAHDDYLRNAASRLSNAAFAVAMICAAAWYACWKRTMFAASSSRFTPDTESRCAASLVWIAVCASLRNFAC